MPEVIRTSRGTPVHSMRRCLYQNKLYAIAYRGPTKKGNEAALLHCLGAVEEKFWVPSADVQIVYSAGTDTSGKTWGGKPDPDAQSGTAVADADVYEVPEKTEVPKKGDKNWSQVEYGHALMCALKHLKEAYGALYFSLDHIAGQCDIPKTSYDTMGKALDKLVVCKRVSCGGSGKKKKLYRLEYDTWDPYNPYSIPADDVDAVDDTTTPTVGQSSAPAPAVDQKFVKLVADMATVINKTTDKVDALTQQLAVTKTRIEELESAAKRTSVLKIEKYDGTVVKIKDVRPKQFDRVVSLVKCRRNVLLYGPAGCGKTHLAEMVSRACGFERFGCISLNAGISDVHILGRAVPNLQKGTNVYQASEFIEIFEQGGLFLFDELDAADPNVLLCINTALANGYITVPNRPAKPKAVKHPDFLCMATANTIGKGATRQYVGRSQLDEATLDRFRIGMVECDYDDQVEASLCPDDTLRAGLQELRRAVVVAGLRRVVSTRFLRDAHVMVSQGGWSYKDVIETLTGSWPDDERQKLTTSLGWAAQSA